MVTSKIAKCDPAGRYSFPYPSVDVGVSRNKTKEKAPRGTPVLWRKPTEFRRAICSLDQVAQHASRSAAHHFHKRGKGWLLEEVSQCATLRVASGW